MAVLCQGSTGARNPGGMSAGDFLVFGGQLALLTAFFRGQRADDTSGDSNSQHPLGHLHPGGNQRPGSDQSLSPDRRAIEHGGLHPD